MNTFNPPTIADLEDIARSMVADVNRLAKYGISPAVVQDRRCELVASMHAAIDQAAGNDEQLAVGRTADGIVVFYDIKTQPNIARLLPIPASRTGEPAPLVTIDEFAALPKPKLDDLSRKAFTQAQKEQQS